MEGMRRTGFNKGVVVEHIGLITDVLDDGEGTMIYIDGQPYVSPNGGCTIRQWLVNAFGSVENAEGVEVAYEIDWLSNALLHIRVV